MCNFKVIALASFLAVLPTLAFAQVSTPLYNQMAEREFGEKVTVERGKLCLLAVKTYDYGVKELGLADADSKQARRADKALPFSTISLKDFTQTDLMFDHAVSDVVDEFSVFKAADSKTQKKFMKAAKGANKTCAKQFEDKKLEGYGRIADASEYLTDISSEDALGCMSVTLSGITADRSTLTTGFQQYLVWGEVREAALRREGYPEDQLIERMKIDDVKNALQDISESKALSLYDMCAVRYKKAHFQANLKKDEPAEVPVIDWK